MKVNKASAVWQGSLKNGEGKMRLSANGSPIPFSFHTRFENGDGTNPESLIGAAHAGCFSMALSNLLTEEGYEPTEISTRAEVKLDSVDGEFKITESYLQTEADVPGIATAAFQKIAEKAKNSCPVSLALGTVTVRLDAKLVSKDQ